MNKLVLPIEEKLEELQQEPANPIIFIVGPPRSGTKLTSQLLANWGGFGYISNFLARFWLAPSVGAAIERGLGLRLTPGTSSLVSEFGRTAGLSEPHEFGYFWDRWFNHSLPLHSLTDAQIKQVDVFGLRRALAALESQLQLPLTFANSTWCTFQTGFLSSTFPRSVFIVCERDPRYVAQSILIARRKLLGSDDKWWSVKPREYDELKSSPWWVQIAGQIYFAVRDMERGLQDIPAHRVVRLRYYELAANPSLAIQKVVNAVRAVGGDVPSDGPAPKALESHNVVRVPPSDWARIEEGVRERWG